MHLKRSFMLAILACVGATGVAAVSNARPNAGAQLCSLGAAAVGQPGTVICKNVLTGVTTQAIQVGPTFAAAGGIAGSLAGDGNHVLVTNQVGGALLFRDVNGRVLAPVALQTNGESSLSGALGDRGAYVLSSTSLRFFPNGQTTASSSRPLLLADGSAAAVTLTNRYAYVSEKNGSLEAFPLGRDGSLVGPAAAVTGVSAGVIVGISGHDDLVVAPIAHLASNANQAEISVVGGLSRTQVVATKEVAACWTANDDDEACVTNPGSMTVSCGQLDSDGFESYTSAATTLVGESAFDVAMQNGLVGMQAVRAGAPMLLTYSRDNSDFLTYVSEFPVGMATASGALLLAPLSR
jgi:uncharacterized protein YunC (DUF1805 family)